MLGDSRHEMGWEPDHCREGASSGGQHRLGRVVDLSQKHAASTPDTQGQANTLTMFQLPAGPALTHIAYEVVSAVGLPSDHSQGLRHHEAALQGRREAGS